MDHNLGSQRLPRALAHGKRCGSISPADVWLRAARRVGWRSVRLNLRLIRGSSAADSSVRSVPSPLVTDAADRYRTVSNRIGKRVGETLKSSNLLSSASVLTRYDPVTAKTKECWATSQWSQFWS